jgi:hypothetical protein
MDPEPILFRLRNVHDNILINNISDVLVLDYRKRDTIMKNLLHLIKSYWHQPVYNLGTVYIHITEEDAEDFINQEDHNWTFPVEKHGHILGNVKIVIGGSDELHERCQ